jgi:hypothetical protein
VEQHHGGGGDGEEAAIRSRTRKRALIRWIINLLMAIVIESIYLFISYASSTLLQSKVGDYGRHDPFRCTYPRPVSPYTHVHMYLWN